MMMKRPSALAPAAAYLAVQRSPPLPATPYVPVQTIFCPRGRIMIWDCIWSVNCIVRV